jgi:hypothetical protein
LVAHIGGDDRDPVETQRSQVNPRSVWMPHSDAHSHAFGDQAVHQSPTEEPPTAEHHNHGHDLLRHALRLLSTKARRPQCLFSGQPRR